MAVKGLTCEPRYIRPNSFVYFPQSGILAMEGTEIPGELYAWTAVLILPINSALNPFLYTLSAVLAKKVGS